MTEHEHTIETRAAVNHCHDAKRPTRCHDCSAWVAVFDRERRRGVGLEPKRGPERERDWQATVRFAAHLRRVILRGDNWRLHVCLVSAPVPDVASYLQELVREVPSRGPKVLAAMVLETFLGTYPRGRLNSHQRAEVERARYPFIPHASDTLRFVGKIDKPGNLRAAKRPTIGAPAGKPKSREHRENIAAARAGRGEQ